MRHLVAMLASLLLAVGAFPSGIPVGAAAALAPVANAAQIAGQLPLAFTGRGGDGSLPYDYKAQGPGYSIFLTPSEAVLVLPDRWPGSTTPR